MARHDPAGGGGGIGGVMGGAGAGAMVALGGGGGLIGALQPLQTAEQLMRSTEQAFVAQAVAEGSVVSVVSSVRWRGAVCGGRGGGGGACVYGRVEVRACVCLCAFASVSLVPLVKAMTSRHCDTT